MVAPGQWAAVTSWDGGRAGGGVTLSTLADKPQPLMEGLAKRGLDLLDLRTNVLRGMGVAGGQDRDRRLFDLAGTVAKVRAAP